MRRRRGSARWKKRRVGGGPWLVRARPKQPRRRLARNYAYFVFEYNLLSFERGPRLFATFARFSSYSLVFPLHQPPTTTAFLSLLSRYTARCQAYRSVVATLSCARDNQLPHATPRLGPREFRGKEMNELASSLTREGGREVGVFEGRSDCGDWEEGGKGLVRILRYICCYWK